MFVPEPEVPVRFTVGNVVPLLRSWKVPPLIVAVVAPVPFVPASVRLFIWKIPARSLVAVAVTPASVWPV